MRRMAGSAKLLKFSSGDDRLVYVVRFLGFRVFLNICTCVYAYMRMHVTT